MDAESRCSLMPGQDAQFSLVTTLKPFDNFEDVYQGQNVVSSIAFPGELDPRAKEEGFDPNLVKGTPVPLGSKLIIWIPAILRPVQGTPNFSLVDYQYSLIWRLRNVGDFKRDRRAYHVSQQTMGANNEFVFPAAVNPLAYESSLFDTQAAAPEQGISSTRGYTETLIPKSIISAGVSGQGRSVGPPLTPEGNTGALQQGVTTSAANSQVFYTPYQVDCLGDELIILANRDDTQGDFWDFSTPSEDPPFGGIDHQFSLLYGRGLGDEPNKEAGILITTGANP